MNLLLTIIWSKFWTDLSIKVKLLRGRGGVIGKGMAENVLNDWTKTMHRSAKVVTLI